MADSPWEFCCGKLIAPVIRRIFFTGVALESIIYPKPKSRKQEIACDFFFSCRVVSFLRHCFFVIVIVFFFLRLLLFLAITDLNLS